MADRTPHLSTLSSNFSPYVNSLPPDAKQRYISKLVYCSNTKSLPDLYAITENWSHNPDTWPDLTFGDIYLYLIDTPSIYTKESMKSYKSLEAYKYVVSGHLQVVLSNPVADNCPFVAITTKVTPSQRARDKPHEPWVYLEKSTGTVYCAHCTCMAGLGEVCSHVGALLFKIEMAVKMGLTQTSSTSQACQWNSNFRKEVMADTMARRLGFMEKFFLFSDNKRNLATRHLLHSSEYAYHTFVITCKVLKIGTVVPLKSICKEPLLIEDQMTYFSCLIEHLCKEHSSFQYQLKESMCVKIRRRIKRELKDSY